MVASKIRVLAEAKPVWEVQYSVEGDETDFPYLIPIWLSYASVSMRDILLEDIQTHPNWYNSELAELKANHNQRYFTNLEHQMDELTVDMIASCATFGQILT